MQAPPTVLRVALPVPLQRLFDYLPPPGVQAASVAIGQRILVPFAARELVGIVSGHGQAEAGIEPKPALALPEGEPLLQGELLASLHWLAGYLHAPLGEVLAGALPAALRRGEPLPDTAVHGWRLSEAGRTALPAMRAGKPQALATLLAGIRDEDWLDGEAPGWRAPLRALRERGLVERIALAMDTQATEPGRIPPAAISLNAEQRSASDAIRAVDGFAAFLLDGVTGSGKTEVYLDAIADCIARGRQALVLVPEIGLTPQALARFRARLGVPVHALHSGLNDGERARAWLAAARGQARVIVGTRSAVFVPLPEAGVIVVDEEHDGSYKQFDGIRYHARDFAIVRARALGVPVVLGSATPSLESLHNAQSGRYAHLRLRQRAGEAKPPAVRVLDVRKQPLQAGLSNAALDAIRAALGAGGQVLVFKNRRGYAPVLLCHDCGWSAHCTRCGTPDKPSAMTVHGGGRRLQCHHCGHRRAVPLACPDCASLALQAQGAGTERIEEVLKERFPDAPVLRIDRGSSQRRDAIERHFAELGSKPGILVGTQMLAKGHDLPNLTLVVVVGVDEGLFSADFRSGEKLAQLLIQVAGRAGRADKPGTVLVQTHHPAHPLLLTLIAGGYHAFAEGELALREAADFPPFAHLALLRAEAKHADPPMQFLQRAKDLLGDAGIEIAGPLPAPMPRRAGYLRAQLILAASERRRLHAALDALMPRLQAMPEARKLRWSLDVDPAELY
ncbi:primosomal protein N' [Thermomonas aquatica]|uniref:Replication restart protein PriA n=1 Tax=Thermomonas aquatica TaxID=2202149 RepID=A0A5B7ZQY5_9GAMM|nr:primosomal protein N' [Thermomonas aquatica]QDA57247.1 primosomal protein N' [Thermomonas aquatica]